MVSIIISAYNVEDTIRKAVDSALAQSYPHIEVVVVEDCSTDHTAEILASYGDSIKLLKHEENKGAGMARRTGLNSCTGDFAICLDADDWMDEDYIARLVARQRETGAEIVAGGVTVERGEGVWEAHCYGSLLLEKNEDIIDIFMKERVRFMNNKIIARRLIEAVEYCGRRFIEDIPTIYPMLYLANKVAYASTTGYHYLCNEKSLTHTASKFKWELFGCLAELDLVKFFESQDFHSCDENLAESIARHVDNIALKVQPGIEDVKQYQEEWNEFTTEIFKRMSS